MKIVTLNFWHNGDRSVGIDGDRATVNLNVDGFDSLDEQEYVDQAKDVLREAFGKLWDCKVCVATDDEISRAVPPAID
jgi:hypothetical protein